MSELLRREPAARRFLGGYALYCLGTGAGYVALLLVAYNRFRSPWAITLVLLADLVPAMLAGPLLGALADRWPYRLSSVGALATSAAAFLGIALTHGYAVTVALALVAGTATALFVPTALAALPTLVAGERLASATSLFGAVRNIGQLVGPALAAAILTFSTPRALVGAIAGVYALATLAVLTVGFPARESAPAAAVPGGHPLLREVREGLSVTMRVRAIRVLVLSAAGAFLFSGMLNVAELLLAKRVLHAGSSGFSLLVASFGVGILAGSLSGARSGTPADYRRRYIGGIVILGLSLAAAGVSPNLPSAALAFAVCGFANGTFLVHLRLLIQLAVPGRLLGRAFGAVDAVMSWAFAVAFVLAGALVDAAGVRTVLIIAGGATVALGILAAVLLRRAWRLEPRPEVAVDPALLGGLEVGGDRSGG